MWNRYGPDGQIGPSIWHMETVILDGQALTLAEIEAVALAALPGCCCSGGLGPGCR